MSYKRRKELFNLVDLQLRADSRTAHQRPPIILKSKSTLSSNKDVRRSRNYDDIFERDPFKVQSYKFHYADRPAVLYPNPTKTLNHLLTLGVNTTPNTTLASRQPTGNRVRGTHSNNNCKTFYYNHGFGDYESNEDDSSLSSVKKSRRRKFVQAQIPCGPQNVFRRRPANILTQNTATTNGSAGNNKHSSGRSGSTDCVLPCFSSSSARSTTQSTYINGGTRQSGNRPTDFFVNNIKGQNAKSVSDTKRYGCNHGSTASIRSAPSAIATLNTQNPRKPQNTAVPPSRRPSRTLSISSQNSIASRTSQRSLMSARSLTPNCQININFNRPPTDNSVSINITSPDDGEVPREISLSRLRDVRLNDLSSTADVLPSPPQATDNSNVDARNSSCTFIVDKRLSKFTIAEQEETKRRRNHEREWAKQHAREMRDKREAVAVIGGLHHIGIQKGRDSRKSETKHTIRQPQLFNNPKEASSSLRAKRLHNSQNINLKNPNNFKPPVEMKSSISASSSKSRPRADSQTSWCSRETKFLNTDRLSTPSVTNSKRPSSPSPAPLNRVSGHCSRQKSTQSLQSNKENIVHGGGSRNLSKTSLSSREVIWRRNDSVASTRTTSLSVSRTTNLRMGRSPASSVERPLNLNINVLPR